MRTGIWVCLLTIGFPAAVYAAAQAGPLAHWDFDEGRGDVLHDRTGNGYDGKIHNAVWAKTEGGGALKFDGSGDYVDCGKALARKLTGDFTLLAWVKLEASSFPTNTTNWVVVSCETYNQSGFLVRIDGATAKITYRSNQANKNQVAFSRAAMENHTYYHVAVTKKGDLVTYYLDGMPGLQFKARAPAAAQVPLRISDPSQSFDGLIDDLKLYDRALPFDRIIGEYKIGAQAHGKDTSWFGKLGLTLYYYPEDQKAIAEVDLRGVVPLGRRRIAVELGKVGGKIVRRQALDEVPASGRRDVEFSLESLPAGRYEVRAVVADGAKIVTSEHARFAYPPAPVAVPSPAQKVVGPLPPEPKPVPFAVELGKGGGVVLRIDGQDYPVRSSFSYPHGGQNLLSSEPGGGEKNWRVTAAPAGKSAYQVRAEGSYYRIDRQITVDAGRRVVFKDTITNKTDQPLGIILSHVMDLKGRGIKRARLAGNGITACKDLSIRTNPTVFVHKAGLGLGMVALDDVLIIQSRGSFDPQGSAAIGSNMFALDAGASYTLEWALYVNASGDYYDFINAVRRDEGRNHVTVQGGFGFVYNYKTAMPSGEYLDLRGMKYVSMPSLANIPDDPEISIEGIEFTEYPKIRQLLREQFEACRQANPGRDLKFMFHIAPNLYATNKPQERFPDSRIIDRNGKPAVYPYHYAGSKYFSPDRIKAGWRWWSVYPTLENSFGKALLASVDVLIDDIGCNGAFVDGYFWGYCGEYTYDRWDGHSAEIDPKTKTIQRKMASVLLLSQPAIVVFTKKMHQRGAVVIANNSIPTRTIGRLNIIVDKEITEGPYVHLAQTPIALGNPSAIRSEIDVYRDVHSKLKWGNLYFYYGEKELTHESAPARMFPITVQEIHSGYVKGKERLVTAHSGVYGWRGKPDLHFVYLYDARGRRIPHRFITTVEPGEVRTRIDLTEMQMAIVKRIPVFLKSDQPVNVHVAQYNSAGIGLILNGSGTVGLVVHSGDFTVAAGKSYRLEAGKPQTVRADASGVLRASIALAGQTRVTVAEAE